VPILTFDWEGVNIDLLFARVAAPSVLPGIDIDDDAILSGVDSATEKSLNGPRVTNLIAALAGGTEERYRTFLCVVRLVRKWAKCRGLYSNKMGYWGGVNINIAVCLVLQLYPNACPASLLRRFFLVFKSWRWPNPVMLTRIHDAELGLPVWSSHQAATMRQVAPMITPAYPAMNSTLSISRQTLQILHEEFCRGHNIVDRLYRDYQRGGVLDDADLSSGEIWRELFEPSDFFIGYPHYLSLCIVGPTQQDAQSWAGFVESRMRKLVSDMMGRSLPLSKVQLWPKKFDACVAERSALLTHAQRANSITYFIGFRVDTLRMRGNQLDVERQLTNFRNFELSRFYPLVPGMDILPKSFGVKELPRMCFEGMYEGGKVGAMRRRRMLIEADPKRREAKNKRTLARLKRKMEAMQRRKKEEADATTDNASANEGESVDEAARAKLEATTADDASDLRNKRKREDEGETDPVKGEDDEDDAEEEEAALLESALDAIEGAVGVERHKTREEAEIDRQKLLAGELLGDGEDEPDRGGDANAALSKGESKSDRKLTREEREAEVLRRAGLVIVSDDEVTVIGGNRILPWRHGYKRPAAGGVKKEEPPDEMGGDDNVNAEKISRKQISGRMTIKFKTKFDIVELDAGGRVIDKGKTDLTSLPHDALLCCKTFIETHHSWLGLLQRRRRFYAVN
jgi:poly(A) polymerase